MKKEGIVRGLYAGTVPSLAANVAENSILFAAYGVCQKLVARTLSVDVSKLSTFSNGCAGTSLIKSPLRQAHNHKMAGLQNNNYIKSIMSIPF